MFEDFVIKKRSSAFDYVPLRVGTVPPGEYRSEIVAVDERDDINGQNYLAICYVLQDDSQAWRVRVHYYSDSRWWEDFSDTLSNYGIAEIADIIGLQEMVTISVPSKGKYLEITARHRIPDAAKRKRLPITKSLQNTETAASHKATSEKNVSDEFDSFLNVSLTDDEG